MHRYLESMLVHAANTLDQLFFYDDQSTDGTFDLASVYAETVSRPHEAPSFAQDEGLFRGAAWRAFEETMVPEPGDWVLVIDCDEQLVGDGRPTKEALLDVICSADEGAVDLNVPEVFGFDQDGCPLVRVDGLWGTIHAPRLFTYRSGGNFSQGRFGVPAVPGYVMATHWETTDLISLMHFGYAAEEDRVAKWQRYRGQPGHNLDHVNSITTTRQMVRWEFPPVEKMIRGNG